MTVPVMCGCREQKYPNCPGLANVNEKRSPVSSTFDLNTPSLDTTVWGMSSPLVQVTVVPALIVTTGALKVKLSMVTAAAGGAGTARAMSATTDIKRMPATSVDAWNARILNALVMGTPGCGQTARVESISAMRSLPRTKNASVMPSMPCSCSGGTLSGPGDGAVPGAGCGKAVERAVWKAIRPSTFWVIWWMWPLSTVTDPNRASNFSASAA